MQLAFWFTFETDGCQKLQRLHAPFQQSAFAFGQTVKSTNVTAGGGGTGALYSRLDGHIIMVSSSISLKNLPICLVLNQQFPMCQFCCTHTLTYMSKVKKGSNSFVFSSFYLHTRASHSFIDIIYFYSYDF